MALAKCVFPAPGGPYRSILFGGETLKLAEGFLVAAQEHTIDGVVRHVNREWFNVRDVDELDGKIKIGRRT